MAQYRLSVYVASRAEGRSAIAMAAYRAATTLYDPDTGEVIDYGRKQGVLYSEIIAPKNSPDWATDRQELWGRSERAHRRKDAIVAREIQLSLPHELSNAERRELATQFARYFADAYQVAVDMNLHAPNRDGDERNYHAHLLVCTRSFDERKKQGLGNNVRDFDAITHRKAGTENHVELWRAEWERMMNDALKRADIRSEDGLTIEAVSHQSHTRRGLDAEPTVKEGVAATAKKRRGEPTERAAQNDNIRERNTERAELAQEITADEQELDLLVRRQAQLLAAREVQERLTSSPEKPALPTPRSAKDLTAPDVQQELTMDAEKWFSWKKGRSNPSTSPPTEPTRKRTWGR